MDKNVKLKEQKELVAKWRENPYALTRKEEKELYDPIVKGIEYGCWLACIQECIYLAPEDHKDVTGDARCNVLCQLKNGQWKGKGYLFSYACTSGRNFTINWAKKKTNNKDIHTLIDLIHLPDELPTPDKLCETKLKKSEINEIISNEAPSKFQDALFDLFNGEVRSATAATRKYNLSKDQFLKWLKSHDHLKGLLKHLSADEGTREAIRSLHRNARGKLYGRL